jgi:hypothetical protein
MIDYQPLNTLFNFYFEELCIRSIFAIPQKGVLRTK